jgi:hypothetical protein
VPSNHVPLRCVRACVCALRGLLAADALSVGVGVILIPFAARHLGTGELAMILLGEVAVAQALL